MKILFVVENYHPKIGGLERLFKGLVDALSDDGHTIYVLTNGSGINAPLITRQENQIIYRLPFFNRYIFTILGVIPAWLIAFRVDLVHTTSYNAAIPGWLAAKCSGRKSVITFHEVWGALWKTLPFISPWSASLHRQFERMILRLNFNHFVGPSAFTARALKAHGVPPHQVSTIHNGIPYQDFAARHPTGLSPVYRFLFFGRLGISKGIDILIDACRILNAEGQKFLVQILVPKKPEKPLRWIKTQIQIHDLENRCTILHSVEDSVLKEMISNVDCVVLPSYSEGFCFAAAETMAIGTPILSSGRGALSEVVGGKHLTYSPQSGAALATTMEKAMRDEWEISPAKVFPLEDSVEKYTKLYHTLIGK